jgi:hypothetical protein
MLTPIKVRKVAPNRFRFFAALGTHCVKCGKKTRNCCFDCRLPYCPECEDKGQHQCEV